jgi:putative MATE family efflux protein
VNRRLSDSLDGIASPLSSPASAPDPDPALDAPTGAAPVEETRIKAGKLAGLTMNRAIWVLSWPIMADSVLNSLVGLTDTVLAANLPSGEAATDAVGGASYVMWLVGLVIMAIDVGVTALVSRAVGAGRLAVAGAAAGQAMLLAVVSGFAVGILVLLLAAPLGALMSLQGESARAFQIYMRVMAAGVPFTAILYAGIAVARGAGDSLRPLGAMFIVNLVNMGLSWTLAGADLKRTTFENGTAITRTVLHNPFGINLGVAGIGLGTAIANAIGAVFITVMLVRGVGGRERREGVVLRARRLRPHAHTMRRLIRTGLPNFAETLGMWAANFLVIIMVGWMGQAVIGAHIVAVRIESFSYLPGFAMGTAAATLAGQFLGAGAPRLAKRAVLRCTVVTIVMMGFMGLLFILIPRRITGLLTSQPTHLDLVPKALFIAGWVQIPFGIGIILRSALRGAGDVKVVMWLTWLTSYGVRLPLAWAFSGVDIPIPHWLGGGVIHNPFGVAGGGLPGLWVGLCAELTARAGVFAARFFHGGWTSVRV